MRRNGWRAFRDRGRAGRPGHNVRVGVGWPKGPVEVRPDRARSLAPRAPRGGQGGHAIILIARGGPTDSNGRRPRGQPAGRPARDTGATAQMTVETSTWATKKGLAQMLKGGVIMDVVTPDQARIAEDAGAVAVM